MDTFESALDTILKFFGLSGSHRPKAPHTTPAVSFGRSLKISIVPYAKPPNVPNSACRADVHREGETERSRALLR